MQRAQAFYARKAHRSAPEVAPEQVMAGDQRLGMASAVLLGWSLLYAIPHLYWGLGGDYGFFMLKPSATEIDLWIEANLFAFALIAAAGLLGYGLQWVRTPYPRMALLAITGAGCAVAASHGAYGIWFRAMSVAGVSDVDGQPFDIDQHGWVLWDMLAIEPWFLVEGVLLGVVGYLALNADRSRRWWILAGAGATLLALLTGLLGLKFA